MKRIKLILVLILIAILILLIVQNTVPVRARFLWLSVDMPLFVLLFLTAAGSFASGLLAAYLIKNDAKSESENQDKRN